MCGRAREARGSGRRQQQRFTTDRLPVIPLLRPSDPVLARAFLLPVGAPPYVRSKKGNHPARIPCRSRLLTKAARDQQRVGLHRTAQENSPSTGGNIKDSKGGNGQEFLATAAMIHQGQQLWKARNDKLMEHRCSRCHDACAGSKTQGGNLAQHNDH